MTNPLSLTDDIALRAIRYYVATDASQIAHTQCVASYTRLIAAGEALPPRRIELLECAAWLHDIGCPESRRKYGNTLPVHQMAEGERIVRLWLADERRLTETEKAWIAETVGGHHRVDKARELHFEPLFEADLLVNLNEGYYDRGQAAALIGKLATTASGTALLNTLYPTTE